ncbi:MAG TPA: LiaF domain-containing protein [Acidimicrobiia bacterium]
MTSRRLGPIVFGALLILAGLGWLLDRLDILDFRIDVFLAAALIVVGAALMWGSRGSEQGGLLALGIVLSLVTVGAALSPVTAITGPIGDRSVTVTQSSDLTAGIELGIGSLEVDLQGLAVVGDISGAISVGIGEVRVRVPADVPVRVVGRSGLGDVKVFDQQQSGVDPRVTYQSPDYSASADRLTLTVEAGLGEVEVTR